MRGALTWQTNRARVLRSCETGAEELLWSELRGRRFHGFKFVRQHPVGPYFADFACRSERIIIEVDGGTHSTEDELDRDGHRTKALEENGYRVFRVSNAEVYENLDGVMDSLLAFVEGEDDA